MKKELWRERVSELDTLLKRGVHERWKALTALETSVPHGGAEEAGLAQMIDHTLLDPFATSEDIRRVCSEAVRFRFGAVCLFPCWIPLAREVRDREEADFRISVVIDFPGGGELTTARVTAVANAFKNGCDEVDIVMPLGLFLSGDYPAVLEDLMAVKQASAGVVKVILELSRMDGLRKRDAALIAFVSGADYLKTSTGVNGRAQPEDVRLLREVAGKICGVKAAGGIRSRDTALAMIRAGADRLGTSSGPALLRRDHAE